AARILYKADLKVCCQALIPLTKIYYEHEYNYDGSNIISNIITTPLDEIYEYEYDDNGSLVITSEALSKAKVYHDIIKEINKNKKFIYTMCIFFIY
ncbi:32454_t:CDS:1, partial [Gigaspora margarita]